MNVRTVRTALVVATLALLVLLGGSGAAAGRTSTTQLPRFIWGAYIGDQFTGEQPPWDWNAVTAFQAKNTGGRHISALHWSVGTPWDHDFNYWRGALEIARNAGVISVVDMGTAKVPLRTITKGTYDTALQTWATEAAAWGQPLLIRFDFEMNGRWYSWGTRPSNQNTPADFVAAWRHVHRIFTTAGATNVLWAWCPNIDPYHQMTDMAKVYPGNNYVDWTCLDGYNFGKPWAGFTKLYSDSYHRVLQLAPNKPMLIGEMGSTERHGNKAHWIRDMFEALAKHFRHVRGLLWFDVFGPNVPGHPIDWPVETSKASSAAFKVGIGITLARFCHGLGGNAKAQCLGTAATP